MARRTARQPDDVFDEANARLTPLTGRTKSIRCLNPDHDDRHPSASLYSNGWFCHVCQKGGDALDYFTKKNGLSVGDALSRLGVHSGAKIIPIRPGPEPVHPDAVRFLARRHTLPVEWTLAKMLATIPPAQARADVLASWDYLADRVDIPFTLHLTSLIRGVALFRYGNARADDQAMKSWVQSLLREVSA